MDFDFSSEQYMLHDSVRRFLADHAGPRQVRAQGATFDAALWQGLADLGLPTLLVPEAHGGAGLGLVDAALLWEEMGRSLLAPPMLQAMVASDTLARHASAVQAGAWLPALAAGQLRPAFAHQETNTGHTAAEVRLQARPSGEGWHLEGDKVLVPAAASATHFLVSARSGDGPAGLFMCTASTPGVAVHAHETMDAHSALCKLSFRGAQAQRLGESPDSPALARLLQAHTLAASLQMVGVAAAAFDLALAYAKQRTQFDRVIGSFQAIKHKFSDMLVALEGARSTAYFAAWALAENDPAQAMAASMAKAACGDMCRLVCNEALQIHGGVGFTHEFDIHWFMRRGKYLEYAFGDASFHRERVASLLLDDAPTTTA